MATLKFLQMSDTHDSHNSLLRIEAARIFANTIPGLDFVIHPGDFVNGRHYRELAVNTHQEGRKSALSALDPKLQRPAAIAHDVYSFAKQVGGLENIEAALAQDEDSPERQEFLAIFQEYLENQTAADAAFAGFASALNKLGLEKKIEEAILDLAHKDHRAINGELKKIRAPVYKVRGNHDLDTIYGGINHGTWLDKQVQPIIIKGVHIAGAPNTYEKLRFIPPILYHDLETDITAGELAGQSDQLIAAKKATSHADVYENELRKNKAYQRLRGMGKIDFLFLHKGTGILCTEPGKFYDSGIGAARIVEDFKPAIESAGHIHGPAYIGGRASRHQIRSSDQNMLLVEYDTTKRVATKIEKYGFFKDGKELPLVQ